MKACIPKGRGKQVARDDKGQWRNPLSIRVWIELFAKEVDLGSHGGIDIVLEVSVVDEMGGSLYGKGNVLGLIGAVGIIFPELDVADDGSKFLGRF